jgi:hypothetical protein
MGLKFPRFARGTVTMGLKFPRFAMGRRFGSPCPQGEP